MPMGSLFLWGLVVAALVTGREVGLWREIIDWVEKNLQTIYRAPPLYFSHPSVESQLARKTDTVAPSNIMT